MSRAIVYFIYPETCGARLEEMDALFGDASTIAGTPSLRAETDSLLPPNSPIGSAVGSEYRGRPISATSGIPNMSLDPPDVGSDGKPLAPGGSEHPTVGSWLARVVNRSRSRASSGASGSGSGRYAPLRQNQGDE